MPTLSLNPVFRLTATIVCLIWAACYVNCTAEMAGFWPNEPSSCCGSKSSEPCDSDSEYPCGICQAFAFGGLWNPNSLGQALLALMALFFTACACIFICHWLPYVPVRRVILKIPPARPPDLRRFWELVARNVLPVRGPTICLA